MPYKQLFVTFISLLFLGATHAQDGAQPVSSELLAPYQIEKVLNDTVVVDFGENNPSSQRETLKEMTIVTPNGTFTATLSRFDKECVDLCSDDLTCHFVGIYTVEAMPPESGEPIVALLGRPAIEDLSMIAMEEVSDAPKAQDWISSDYTRTLNNHSGRSNEVGEPFPGGAWRWRQDDQNESKVFLEREDGASGIELAGCVEQEYRSFTLLQCEAHERSFSPAALLYEDRKLLITSFAEYGIAAADLLAEFNFGGNTHYLVKIGLKAQAPIGIIQPSRNSWKLLLRPKDYPTLC